MLQPWEGPLNLYLEIPPYLAWPISIHLPGIIINETSPWKPFLPSPCEQGSPTVAHRPQHADRPYCAEVSVHLSVFTASLRLHPARFLLPE